MIVSLEAIFLSTFVMISQNRADAKRQVIADQQWKTVQEEDQQNEELLDLSKQILDADQGDPRFDPRQVGRNRLARPLTSQAMVATVEVEHRVTPPEPSSPGRLRPRDDRPERRRVARLLA